MSNFLGIDIGTSKIKFILTDGRGNTLFSKSDETCESSDKINAADILNKIILLIRNIPAVLREDITAIAFSTFMHSIMAVDKKIIPLTDLFMWYENKGAEFIEELKDSELAKILYSRCGTPIHFISPLIKLKWCCKHLPEICEKADYFIGIKEYILYHFTGEKIVDSSIASATGMYDLYDNNWNANSLEYIHLNSDKLFSIVGSSTNKFSISKEMADRCGIISDCMIIPGASDGCLANLGSFALTPKDLVISLGTSAAVRKTVTSIFLDSSLSELFCYHLDDEYFVVGGASNNCGNVISFYKEKEEIENWDQINSILQSCIPESDWPFFIPYQYGERCPVMINKNLSGYTSEVTSFTSEIRLYLIFEGIMFNLKMIFEKIEKLGKNSVSRILLNGGLSKLNAICQLLADVINLPVIINQKDDTVAFGAAIMAIKTKFNLDDYSQFADNGRLQKTYKPNKMKSDLLAVRFIQFKKEAQNSINNDNFRFH